MYAIDLIMNIYNKYHLKRNNEKKITTVKYYLTLKKIVCQHWFALTADYSIEFLTHIHIGIVNT